MGSGGWAARTAVVVIGGALACWGTVAIPAATAGTGPARQGAAWSAARHAAPLVRDAGAARRGKQGLAAPRMSARMLAANAERQARARRFLRLLQENVSADVKCTSRACRTGLPGARILKPTQQPQVTNYYCGPATVSEMLAQLGRTVSQSRAARELGTTASGTNWSDDVGYPVPDVLNSNQKKNVYVAVALPWAPTTADIHTFETDLVADMNHNGGVPLAGNAYEVAGGPHLVGNPVNQTIFHWFDIRGYSNYGAVTDYEDSVHGASSIGWAANVPAYSSMATSAVVNILGARGYAW